MLISYTFYHTIIYMYFLTNGLMCTVKKLRRMMYYELYNLIVLPMWERKVKLGRMNMVLIIVSHCTE